MGVPIFLFLVGLVLLIKGGDWFVDGATGIAHRFHIPELLIGATVVSIGTTLPEVMVSATSAVSGHGEIACGSEIRLRRVKERILFHIATKEQYFTMCDSTLFHIRRKANISLEKLTAL